MTSGNSSEGMLGGQAQGKETQAPESGAGLTQGPGRTPRKARLQRWYGDRMGRNCSLPHGTGGGVRVTQTSIPGLGRMVMPLLETSASEEERAVGEVSIESYLWSSRK